ncbi:g380 [Coccomyxa elongata]
MNGPGPWRLAGTHRYSGSAAHPPRPCFHPRQQGCYRSPVAAPPGPRYPTTKLVAGAPSHQTPHLRCLPLRPAGAVATGALRQRCRQSGLCDGVCSRAPAGACYRGPALPAAQAGRCGPYQGGWKLGGHACICGAAAIGTPQQEHRTSAAARAGVCFRGQWVPHPIRPVRVSTPRRQGCYRSPVAAQSIIPDNEARCRGTEPSHTAPAQPAAAAQAGRGPALTAAQGPLQEHRTRAAATVAACASGASAGACYRGIRTPVATGPQVPPAPSTFFHPLLQLCERPKGCFVDDSASANCGLLLQIAGSKPP